ncbi:MAG: M24 family metallopeptidase [Anaerolineales bacterium]|jgi:antitoxin VapB
MPVTVRASEAQDLATPRNDPRVVADAALKRERTRAWLEQSGREGVILSRRDNFAWLSAGGDSRVVECTELGFGSAVITRRGQYIVAHSMDAARLLEEQVPGQGYELVSMRWYQGDPRERAKDLAGPGSAAADTPWPGTEYSEPDLVDLHYPMTDLEIGRCRWLGRQSDEILTETARSLKPGMSENEAATAMRIGHLRRGLDVDVLILGSDERVFRYRHPMPTDKPIQKYALLHSVARRWGLHSNVTRCVHFGEPSVEIRRVCEAAATIEGRLFAKLHAGVRFADILEWQKAWYKELGFPEEWHYHFQGGPTGYVIVDATRCLTDKVVQVNQPFEWFITITGTKVGELALLTKSGLEIASQGNHWPTYFVETDNGVVEVPGLMQLEIEERGSI